VAVLYRLTGAVAGTGAALLAAALLAVHPQQVELSTMARAYAVVALVGLASSWVLVARERRTDRRGAQEPGGAYTPGTARATDGLAGGAGPASAAVRDGWPRLLAYTALTALAVHLHYSALLVAAAQVAWLAARRRWRAAAAGALGAASVLPWFLWSAGVGYAAEQNLVWIPPFSEQTVTLWLTTQLVDLDVRWMSPEALALRWLLLVPVLALVVTGALRIGRGRASREGRLLVWLWLVPAVLGLASVAAGTNVLHKARYFATSSAALAALAAVGILSLRLTPRLRAAVAAAVLAAAAAASLAEVREPTGTDWRGMVRVLEAERRPGEALLVLPDIPLRLLTLRHYHDGPYRLLGEEPPGSPPPAGVWIALSPHAFEATRSRDREAAEAARQHLRRLQQRYPRLHEYPLRAGTLLHLDHPGTPKRSTRED
jgi:hypothetical protein